MTGRRGSDSESEWLDDDSIDPLNSSVVCLGYAPKKKIIEMIVLSSDEENSPKTAVSRTKSRDGRRVQDDDDEDEPEVLRQTESNDHVHVLNTTPPFRSHQPNNAERRTYNVHPRSLNMSDRRIEETLRKTRDANAEKASAQRKR